KQPVFDRVGEEVVPVRVVMTVAANHIAAHVLVVRPAGLLVLALVNSVHVEEGNAVGSGRSGCEWTAAQSPRPARATAAMSDRPVTLASCLRSLAGAVCAGCRCLPVRGSAAGRLAAGRGMGSTTTRLCRGHRTAC